MIPDLVAHGFGGRTDLPLSVWMFGYGAAAVLVISFAALKTFWPEPRLEPEPGEGSEQAASSSGPTSTSRSVGSAAVRCLGVVLLFVVLGAATLGDSDPVANLAPVAIYIIFWVGLTAICGFVVDAWNFGLNPFSTLGIVLEPATPRPYSLGHWPAAAGIFAFVWLELAAPSRAEPRVLAVLIVVYAAVVLIGAAVWGEPWRREGDPFVAWFGLVGRMSPIGPDGLRRPLVGLASLSALPGTVALVLVALGSTAFDGLTRSTLWSNLIGDLSWNRVVIVSTVGLGWSIGVVALLYLGAMKAASAMTGTPTRDLADAFIHSLVPIAFAYAVAHYFSLLVLEGQAAIALISDPFGLGWDLFGTVDRAIDYTLVSPNAIAYVQVAAIVIGHVAGVVLAHDRALALFPPAVATRSQYPLLAAMVAFTVGGLGLLLGS